MILRTAITSAAAALLAVSFAANANADAQDDQFLGAVAAQGINVPADQLIPFGRNMCDVVGGFGAMGPQYAFMTSTGLSMQQVSAVVGSAVRAYCPNKMPPGIPGLMPPG